VVDALDATAREVGVPMWSAWSVGFQGILAFYDGDARRGIDLLRRAVDASVVPIQRVGLLAYLTEAEVASSTEPARARCNELLDAAAAAGYDFVAAQGHLLTARLLRRDGALSDAECAAYTALGLAQRLRLQPNIIEVLEVLGALATDREDDERAIRLFAVAGAARDRTGYALSVFQRERDVETLRARSETFDAVWSEGSALTLEEAITYVRRGRGERKRPRAGWESLTPTELEVVELVRDGCTNAEIGKRMFVSTRTVQAHLTRLFAKLGIRSRAELAAIAAERRVRPL